MRNVARGIMGLFAVLALAVATDSAGGQPPMPADCSTKHKGSVCAVLTYEDEVVAVLYYPEL